MKAAICVRVSPRPQDKVRYSPELQEGKCREYVTSQDGEVVTVIQDILVSGGASDRFDSIFAALERFDIDTFVVSDLSRWTRDRPSRFWAMKAILEDRGIALVSVDEPWLGSEVPFSDTVTTAKVEANYQERLVMKRKTSAGVRAAWAQGKRWGRPWGWSWDPVTRTYSQDVKLITAFYQDVIDGIPNGMIARRYGLAQSNVYQRARSIAQRDIVGEEMWNLAQSKLPHGTRRAPAKVRLSNIYRGLLACPFCGNVMFQHDARHWGNYRCTAYARGGHEWWTFSARKHVTPVVRELLGRFHLPDDEPLEEPRPVEVIGRTPEEARVEMDRLTEAWIKGRISEARYEKLVVELQSDIDRPPAIIVPPDVQVERIASLGIIDLDTRDPELGAIVNELLIEMVTIELREDRSAIALPRPQYAHWLAKERVLAAV